MKAAILSAPDGMPSYGDFPDPETKAGRERVALVAAGIHPVVHALATGTHYGSKGLWPMIPGIDAVARTEDGTLIYTGFVEAPYGTFAECMVIPTAMRFPLPVGADPLQIAAGMNPGLASWMPLLARKKHVDRLGTVLVLGVTGMAGALAVQNAFAMGAEIVIGTGRNQAGLRRAASHRAKTVELTGNRDADAKAIADALGSTSPSLVLDFVWGEPAEAALIALGGKGLAEDSSDIVYVQIGAMAGASASVPASTLRSRRIQIVGSGSGTASIADVLAQLPIYMQLVTDGRVEVPIRVFPLSKIAEAWSTRGESGQRVVIVPG